MIFHVKQTSDAKYDEIRNLYLINVLESINISICPKNLTKNHSYIVN